MDYYKIKTTILALIFLSQPIQTKTDSSDTLKTVGIIGGVVAIGCGIAAGINHLCTPSNESLINNGHDALNRMQSRYDSLIRYCEPRGYKLNEGDFSFIAGSYVRGSIDSYKRGLRDGLHELSRARKDLNDRMHKLERKGERYNFDYRSMDRLAEDLYKSESSLKSVLDILDNHTGYFELYSCEGDIRRNYSAVVDIVDRYGANRMNLAQYLREQVAVDGSVNRIMYPTLSYVEKLNDMMRNLEKAIQHCSHNYEIVMRATTLYNKLSQARTVLLADDRYAYEMQERERARREEERMRIERDRLAAEERKAQAAQRQAYAAEQHNREMARQNEILREQNRIERERMNRHRYCEYNHCCCNAVEECPTIRIEIVR
jgi:hypothetical protein